MCIYIYTQTDIRSLKRCNLKIYMKYIYLLFSQNKRCIYFYMFFKLQRKQGIYLSMPAS